VIVKWKVIADENNPTIERILGTFQVTFSIQAKQRKMKKMKGIIRLKKIIKRKNIQTE
jgi:hypothetical protein